jgi:F-type H+/Na+-transporting ATPase subunit alpha
MMNLKADEISSIIKKQIEGYEDKIEMEEVGIVLEVGDGIARAYGLRNIMAQEMVEFENGIQGVAFNLEEDSVGIIILGEFLEIKEGFQVKRLKYLLSVPCGDALIGRVVDPIGNPLDNKGPINTDKSWPVERKASGIAARKPVDVPLQTGIKAIDSMIPIGRGQRELIIGDRSTGKTVIAIDTILNQKGKDVICIYVAIGQKTADVVGIIERLKEAGAMEYTIVVSASASEPAPLQYIAPYSGAAMAEYFMFKEGKDTLCIYDDLSKHANAYRQLSLLLNRPPGREAYPGDVFYLHSRLLERAARLNEEHGGGSMTALPIIETQEGEVSAYIPTNVISITDGQIYLLPNLFAAGQRPAVDVGISVSRVGGKAQIPAMKKVAGSLRLDLAAFRELEAFAQLGTELDKVTQRQLDRGYRLVEILKQNKFRPVPVEEQVVIIIAGTSGLLDTFPLDYIARFETEFIEHLKTDHPEVLKHIQETKQLYDDAKLKEITKNYIDQFRREKGIK